MGVAMNGKVIMLSAILFSSSFVGAAAAAAGEGFYVEAGFPLEPMHVWSAACFDAKAEEVPRAKEVAAELCQKNRSISTAARLRRALVGENVAQIKTYEGCRSESSPGGGPETVNQVASAGPVGSEPGEYSDRGKVLLSRREQESTQRFTRT